MTAKPRVLKQAGQVRFLLSKASPLNERAKTRLKTDISEGKMMVAKKKK